MDTGKVPFGTKIYLVVKNPYYEKVCPCCGHKPAEKVDKWIVVEGIYSKLEINFEDLSYYATWVNRKSRKCEETLINRYYLFDIIDSDIYDKREEHYGCDIYSKDIDVCEYRGEFEGTHAFHTKEEAEKFIKRFGYSL